MSNLYPKEIPTGAKLLWMQPRSIILLTTVIIAACGGGGGGGHNSMSAPPQPVGQSIADLKNMQQLASTIAPNGDANPYGLATPPAGYTTTGVLQPGDILISNFSDSTGTPVGKTIMRYVPSSGQMSLFYTNKVGTGPTALAVGPTGFTWIANYQLGYINLADGASTGDGNEIIVAPDGTDLPSNTGIIDNNSGATFDPSQATFSGPWGQVLAQPAGSAATYFFTSEVNTGWVQRQEIVTPLNATHLVTIGQLPVGHNNFDPTGPQGMAYDAQRDILYVASTASNAIVAFSGASTAPASFSSGTVVFSGMPLNAPVGLALNPTNGDLIAVNQLDNNMVEIAPNPSTQTPGSGGGGGGYAVMAAPAQAATSTTMTFSGKLIATKTLDTTTVNAQAGTGSALFGVLAVKDTNNNLVVYYTNSNTNTLNVLK